MNIQELSSDIAALVSKLGAHIYGIRSGRSRGSAFSPEAGFLVTAAHNVSDRGPVTVFNAEGEESRAELIGMDRRLDLALLEYGPASETPDFSGDADLSVGNLVFPLGRPGRTVRAAFGMVSAVGGEWRLPHGGKLSRYIETDGTLPHGFSGGPLMDAAGKVAGMNSSRPRGSGMTVPMEDIRRTIERIRNEGDVKTAYLGVNTMPVPLGKGADSSQSSALIVTEVEEGSPADLADLRQGDVILKIADTAVADIGDLMSILSSGISGKNELISILRAGEAMEITITPSQR